VVLEKVGEDQLGRFVRNELVLHKVNGDRNNLHTKKIKPNRIGHILRRNCLLKHITEEKLEGKIAVTVRRGRSRKQLLDNLKDSIGYWKLKEEALDCTLCKIRLGRGYGPVVRKTAE
jgi:hypothetical protein